MHWLVSACSSGLRFFFPPLQSNPGELKRSSWSGHVECLYSHHAFTLSVLFIWCARTMLRLCRGAGASLSTRWSVVAWSCFNRVALPFVLFFFVVFFPLVDLTFLHESCKTFHGELVNFEKMVSDDACAHPVVLAADLFHDYCQKNSVRTESSCFFCLFLLFSYSIKLQKWWGASGGTGVLR